MSTAIKEHSMGNMSYQFWFKTWVQTLLVPLPRRTLPSSTWHLCSDWVGCQTFVILCIFAVHDATFAMRDIFSATYAMCDIYHNTTSDIIAIYKICNTRTSRHTKMNAFVICVELNLKISSSKTELRTSCKGRTPNFEHVDGCVLQMWNVWQL